MPTPFYHLSLAEDLLYHPNLSEAARAWLLECRSAFLLGNTAPDVQTVSGQDRQVTHFFDLPILPGMPPAWRRMLKTYPQLSRSNRLAEPQAAFLAGYLCHLQADWFWVLQIFAPVFGPPAPWNSFRHRLYLHNVLRSYLDEQILPKLELDTGSLLEQAAPREWLPFVNDHFLIQWRDLLTDQLRPGAEVQTVEVFAARQGISPGAYYELMGSEQRMDEEIFSRLSRQTLSDYRSRLIDENLRLLNGYLDGHNQ